MPEPRVTADFIRSIGSDLRGLELLTVEMPNGYGKGYGRNVPQPAIRPPGAPLIIRITRRFDASSPALFKLCASGELVERVVITTHPDRWPSTILTLTGVVLTEISRQSDGVDAIKLSYGRIAATWTYVKDMDFSRNRLFYDTPRGK